MLIERRPRSVGYVNRLYRNPTYAVGAGAATAGSYLARKAYNYIKSKPSSVVPTTIVNRSNKKKKLRPKKQTLKKAVKALQKEIKSEQATLIFRQRYIQYIRPAVNSQTTGVFGGCTCSDMETVLGQLRFFDPVTPGTLVQASGASGTYMRQYHFKSIVSTLLFVNNYQVPCYVTLYLCEPKSDTNIAVNTAFANGLADVGNPSSTSPLVYLTDSSEFNSLWKISSSKKARLEPGQSLIMSHNVKDVMYDPSIYDSHTFSYQKKFKNFQWAHRVEGVIGHDSSALQVGQLAAGVDCTVKDVYTVEYDAGIDLTYIYVSDNVSAFTNGGVVSEQPVADNIGYSVA